MSIKHVVTLGFGFADGTKYVTTLGFGFSIVVAGPFTIDMVCTYFAGPDPDAVDGTVAGAVATQVFLAGADTDAVQGVG